MYVMGDIQGTIIIGGVTSREGLSVNSSPALGPGASLRAPGFGAPHQADTGVNQGRRGVTLVSIDES